MAHIYVTPDCTNRTYSFPVSGFHERAFAICSEGISETRLTSLNSVRNRLVGYSLDLGSVCCT
jgi:hypothetical protein